MFINSINLVIAGVRVGGLWTCTGEDLSKTSGKEPLIHLKRDLSARLLRAAQDVSKYIRPGHSQREDTITKIG